MWRGSPGPVWGRGKGDGDGIHSLSLMWKYRKVCLRLLVKAPICCQVPCFRGPGLGRVDKHAPGSTPLPTNWQARGWLLLKGQALVSPGSASTKRDPRGQMGSWRLSLPEDQVRSGLDGLAELLVPPHPPTPIPVSLPLFWLWSLPTGAAGR